MMTPWKKIKETIAYDGWRGIIRKKFELPDGKIADFDIVQNNPFVIIAAFTPEKEAILIRQYRPGPEKDITSFPEGMLEKNENPIDAASRELLEETGYEAEKIIPLKNFYSAYSTETRIGLLAINCKKISTQQLDESEFIEVFKMPLNEFRSYMRDANDAEFNNVDCGYLALDHLGWL